MISSDPSGLQIITTYYFKVNSVEYNILTGDPAPSFQEVVDLMDVALNSAGFSAVIIFDDLGDDIRIINEGDRGWDSEIDLEFGTSGPNLWINLIGFIGFDPAVPGRGAFSLNVNALVEDGGKIQIDGTAIYSFINEPPIGSIIISGISLPVIIDIIGTQAFGELLTSGTGYYQIGYVWLPGGIQDDIEVGTLGDIVYGDNWYMSANPESGIRIKMSGAAEYELEIIAIVEDGGKVVISGTAITIVDKFMTPEGGITISGSVAVDEFILSFDGSGVATFAGASITTHTNKYIWDVSGGAVFAGSGDVAIEYTYNGLWFGDNYYPFDERTGITVNDMFAGANDITLSAGDLWTEDAVFISAAEFGKGDWSTLGVDINPQAVSFWHKRKTIDQEIKWIQRTSSFGAIVINSIAHNSSNLWVAVAAAGKLATSSNGIDWTQQTSSFGTTIINRVTYNNSNLWVAVGSLGQLATSPNGIDWTQQTSSFGTDTIYGIAHNGSNLWVAVGNSGKLATSSNGIDWTQQTSSFGTTKIRGIAHNGSNLWIAVGNSGKLATSLNGIDWTQQTSSFETTTIDNVAHNGSNLWVAVGESGKLATSSNGIDWTQQTSSFGADTLRDVAHNQSNLWIAVGTSGKLATSLNGIDWTQQTSSFETTVITSIAYNNSDLWVAVGSIGKLATYVGMWAPSAKEDRVFGASADDEHWYFAYEPPYFRAMIRNGANYYYFFNGTDYLLIPDDDQYHWYYVEFYSGSNAIVYVDNVYRGTTSNFFSTNTYKLHTIGNGGDAISSGIYGFGPIDDLRIYSSYRLDADQRNIVYTQSPDPGSIVIGGSAKIQPVILTGGEYVYMPTGAIILTGERYNYIVKSTAITISGTSPIGSEFIYVSSGGIILQSTSTYHDFGLGYVYVASGAADTTGSSITTHTRNFSYTSSGGIEISSKNLIVIIIEATNYYILFQGTGVIKTSGSAGVVLDDIIATVEGGVITLSGAIGDPIIGVVAKTPSGKAKLQGSAIYSWAPNSGYQELGL